MDHAAMGHSMGDMGHEMPGMPSGDDAMCQMSMLFTWDTQDLCIVFKWWHIRSTLGLLLSLAAIVGLTAGYELVKKIFRDYESRALADLGNTEYNSINSEAGPVLSSPSSGRFASKVKILRAAGYASQVTYSFLLMLVFMTYNGWAMLSVALGAFLGYYYWGEDQTSARQMACH